METEKKSCSITTKDDHKDSSEEQESSITTILFCLICIDPNGELCEYLKGVAEAEDVQSYVENNPFGIPAITEELFSYFKG
jgi:hypothetical protein